MSDSDVPDWAPEWAEKQSYEVHELALELEPMLRERVRNRPRDQRIRYAELGRRVGRFYRDPVFLSALGLVSYRSLLRHGYALSALVVNESGRPGANFYPWVSGARKPNEDAQWELFLDQLGKIKGR